MEKKSSVTVDSFLPGRAKDLSALLYLLFPQFYAKSISPNINILDTELQFDKSVHAACMRLIPWVCAYIELAN